VPVSGHGFALRLHFYYYYYYYYYCYYYYYYYYCCCCSHGMFYLCFDVVFV
jgi:hypothetical protein